MNRSKLSGPTLLLISAVLFFLAFCMTQLIAQSHRHSSSAYEPWTLGRLLESSPLFLFMASFGGFVFAGMRCRGKYRIVAILCLLPVTIIYVWSYYQLSAGWLRFSE